VTSERAAAGSPASAVATRGPVHVVGAGLLGASVGLGLATRGVRVTLEDTSPTALALARDVGAGAPAAPGDPEPALVVVATPPDVAARTVAAQLRAYPNALVTDVASVKSAVLGDLAAMPAHERPGWERYVGSHPMAGRERSGAAGASADLFAARPWVITDGGTSGPAAVLAVRALAVDLGAIPMELTPQEHDDAVALVSHLPQLAASLVAAQLADAPDAALALAGQGLRDVTRIAASDPVLWAAILSGNAAPVARALRGVAEGIERILPALDAAATAGLTAPGALHAVAATIAAGNAGVARIPGKHGGAPRRYGEVTVLVPDRPGELGRLFGEVGEVGVNIEDLTLEHSPRQRVGMATLAVVPSAARMLEEALELRGWRVVYR
jgi:prephenate dehydrogenase